MKKIMPLLIVITLFISGCSLGKKNEYPNYHNEDNKYKSENADYGLGEAMNELLNYQKEVDQMVDDLTKDKKITFDKMQVITNPYKLSHLSALAIFYTESKESVKVFIEDELLFELPKSNEHAVPIYGLYSGKNNKVTLELSNGTKEEIYIQTDEVIAKNLEVSINKLENGKFFYSSSSNSDEDVAYDSNGNVRWYMNGNLNKDLLILSNGHILVSNGVERDERRNDIPTGLIEVDYLGKIYKQHLIPNGVHHELRELSENRVLLCSFAAGEYSRNDMIYIVNLENGKIEKTINLFEVVKKISPEWALEIEDDEDWTHINSVAVDDTKGLVYVSFRGMNSIMVIGLNDQEIKYIYTNTPDSWHKDFKKYIVSIDSDDYIMGQHSLSIVDGNIGVFNNNANMDYRTDGYGTFHGYSFPAIYKLSKDKVELVYKYKSDTKYYSKSHGTFTVYENNHKLVNYSMTEEKDDGSQYKYMIIMELDENDKVIYQARKENDSTYSFYEGKMYDSVKYFEPTEYKEVKFS